MILSTWINFNGNTEEAFTFYQSIFGGEFIKIIRFKDLVSQGIEVSESEANKIMYIALPIGDKNKLIGNDVPSFMGKVSENENRSKIHLTLPNKEEVARIFAALSIDGNIEGDLDISPWGSYAGILRDKYGIEWIIESL
jgi:PhnB protein